MISGPGRKSPLPQFLRGILATGAGSASILVLGMVALMVSTRVISAETLGAFFLAQVLVTFLAEGTSMGIYSALEQSYAGAQTEDTRRGILSAAMMCRAATALIVVLVLVALGPSLLPMLDIMPTPWMLVLLVGWFLLDSQLRLMYSFHQASFNFGVIGMAGILSSVLNLIGIILFVLVLQQDLWGLFYAKILSNSVALAYTTLARPLPLSLRLDLTILRRMLKYGWPLYLNYFLSFVTLRADTLVIGWLLGTGAVAFYEIARRIPEGIGQFFSSFRQVYFPYVARAAARNDYAEVSSLINRSLRIGSFFLFSFCLMALGFDREIMKLLFSEQYVASALPFVILMVAHAFLMIESTLGYALAAIGDSTKPPIINAVRSALLLIAYLVLIPPYGGAGAATAAALAAMAVIPVNVLFLRRRALTIKPRAYVMPGALAMVVGMMMIAADGWGTWAEVVVMVLYLPACLISGVIRKEEVRNALAFLEQRLGRRAREADWEPRPSSGEN